MPEEQIILVDKDNTQIGKGGKLETHRKGLRHRAFSIFIINDRGELMLQKRALGKYHSGGLWTNTCCGHPRDGEDVAVAAHRRLGEEMNFDCDLKEILSFHYEAQVSDTLRENEIDHVFVGEYEKDPILNPEEASDWRWVSFPDLAEDIEKNPQNYTYWIKVVLLDIREKIGK